MLDGLAVVIVGAGIGGLAAARALALRGAEVTVLEQAGEITDVGAGLQVSPNGMRVIEALGLRNALRATAVRADAVSLRDYKRGEVLRLDLALSEAQEYYFVHRADLINLLAEGARTVGVTLRLLQKVVSVTDGARPVLKLATGSALEADLVIGADGVHSVLRGALNGAAAPFFTGHAAWRAVVPCPEGRAPEVWVHMAPKRHLVSYPLQGGQLLNLVAVQEQRHWVEESWSLQDDPSNLCAAFADFGAEARALLERVETAGYWGLFRHPVARLWHGQGVALLGDAAHPTLPFLAQGAVMALEDAWVLADRVSKAPSLSEGLDAYQTAREARVRRVVKAATGNAWKYHLSFPPLRAAAHGVLRLGGAVAPARMLKQFDWLYGADVTDF